MDLAIAGIISSPKIIVTSYYHRREHALTRKVLWFSWMKKSGRSYIKRAVLCVLLVGEKVSMLASHYSETRCKTIIMLNGLVRMYLVTNCKDKTVATWSTLGELRKYKRLS
jgi:hypothetical protein